MSESQPSAKYLGFHELEDLPIKRGQEVTIRKGTRIRTMLPNPAEKVLTAGRTYKVTVHHLLNGMSETFWDQDSVTGKPVQVKKPIANPSVRWPGRGGYWYEVDINDIPEAQ